MTHDLNGPTRRDEPIEPRIWFDPVLDPIPAPEPSRLFRDSGGPVLFLFIALCAIGALSCIGAALWLGSLTPALTECRL